MVMNCYCLFLGPTFAIGSTLYTLSVDNTTVVNLEATSLHNSQILFFTLRGNHSGVEFEFNLTTGNLLKVRIGASELLQDQNSIAIHGQR